MSRPPHPFARLREDGMEMFCADVNLVAPPSRRLSGGRLRPPRRGRDALGTAGKMPALLVFQP
jgi:hypothetical protein